MFVEDQVVCYTTAMNAIKEKIVKYSFAISSNTMGLAAGVVSQIVLARLMGGNNYGLLALTLTLVLLPVKLSDLGVFAAMQRMLSFYIGDKSYGNIRKLLRHTLYFVLAVSTALMSVIMLLAGVLEQSFDIRRLQATLLVFSAFIPFIYLSRWMMTGLNGLGHNATRVWLESFLIQLFTAVFSIALWVETRNVYMVVFGHGLAYVVIDILAIKYLLPAYRSLPSGEGNESFYDFKDIVRQGIPMNLSTMGQKLFERTDIIVVGAVLGEGAVGLYKVAYTLASGAKQLAAPLNSFADFFMSKRVGEGREDIIDCFNLAVWGNLAIALPVYFLMYAKADFILSLLYGPEYIRATVLLKILCIGFVIFVCTGPMASFFCAVGRNWMRLRIVTVAALLNIVLNIILSHAIGITGAAISTNICFIMIAVSFTFFTRPYYGARRFRVFLMKLTGVLILSGALIYILSRLEPLPFWTHMGIVLLFSAGIFSVCAFQAYRAYKGMLLQTALKVKNEKTASDQICREGLWGLAACEKGD